MLKEERQVVHHAGVYKPTATTAEAMFMITGSTIGAGVLALPFAVATVGPILGAIILIVLASITILLQLMLGEIAVRTAIPLQLPGLAGKYLGKFAKGFISFTIILRSYGALIAYLLGAGTALSVLLGGEVISWTIIFWSIVSALIWAGLQRVKQAEKFMSLAVMFIIVGISFFAFPHITIPNLLFINTSNLLLPIGVILFALSSTPAVAEAHALLPGSERHFRRALIFGTLLPAIVYFLFMISTVGALGSDTTPVATVGLGNRFGTGMLLFGTIFAVLAMGTAFMGLGTALKETFMWDHKVPSMYATFLVILVPLALLLLGARGFVTILEVVGGVFIATENAIMALVYYHARVAGDIQPRFFKLSHARLATSVVLAFFLAVAVASGLDVVHKLFIK